MGICISLAVNLAPAEAYDWQVGDVFVAVSNGSYQVYDSSGNLKEMISDGMGGYTTGCAFNGALDKFYTTNFGNTKVVVYDEAHPHNIVQIIDTSVTSPGGHSESVLFDGAGNFYIGHPDGNKDIHKYDPAGNLLQTFDVAIERRGSDWMDLAVDQQTLFYTSEGSLIMRFDVLNNVQMANFASIGGISYALRLLPPGDGSGGLLVANTNDIKRLDGGGNVVQTYDATGQNSWFALNLDPDGSSFWSADFGTSNFYKFDIQSGAILMGPINTGTGSNTVFGICVMGEITAAQEKHVAIDIKPQSCPNPLNIKNKGVVPVAVLGTDEFDVSEIDPATITLSREGIDDKVHALRFAYEDVATPFEGELCDCHTLGADGYLDLTLKFDTTELVEKLQLTDVVGETIELTLTGNLLEEYDGIAIRGEDCIRVQ